MGGQAEDGHRAVDVIIYLVGSGRRETAMSSVHHGWLFDNKEWIEYIVAVVVLWLLMMTAVSVFDLRSAG
jgi:L-asparagine transporter-like permease